MMGITYIEVDGEDVQGLDKVWPHMLNLFSVIPIIAIYRAIVLIDNIIDAE